MKNEILDDLKEEEQTNYSKLMYQYFLIQLFFFIILILTIYLKWDADFFEAYYGISFILIFGFNVLALNCLFKALKNEERKDTFYKIGLIGNILFFVYWMIVLGITFYEISSLLRIDEIG